MIPMQPNKITTLLLLFFLFHVYGYSQNNIDYDNNAAAGKYFNIRGFKMYCEVYGTGKPILMIHGNGGSIGSFTDNAPYFSEKYQVILADSRAQGNSHDDKDSLTFEMMADDEVALMD